MFVIIGYVVVLIAVFGGYALAGGKFGVLAKAAPIELFIICGAAIGAFLVGNSAKSLKATVKALPTLFKGSKYTKARYMELMALLYEILTKARKEGLIAIEQDVESPHESPIFKRYPNAVGDHHLVEFITDYLRMMVSGNLNPHEIESLMDSEIETHHQEAHGPMNSIAKLGDALPAFGIVAAVLGVVKTMGAIDQPPPVLGALIGGALVGTFLGVFFAYGFVDPLANRLKQIIDDEGEIYKVVKQIIIGTMHGHPPPLIIEAARVSISHHNQPSFAEVFDGLRGK